MLKTIGKTFRPTAGRLMLPATAVAITLLAWALSGRNWTGPFYDGLGVLASVFVALPSTVLAEVLGPSQTIFRCNFIACEPASAGTWFAIAAGDAGVLYVMSCAVSAAIGRVRRKTPPATEQ